LKDRQSQKQGRNKDYPGKPSRGRKPSKLPKSECQLQGTQKYRVGLGKWAIAFIWSKLLYDEIILRLGEEIRIRRCNDIDFSVVSLFMIFFATIFTF
jgi:hypothetical protein